MREKPRFTKAQLMESKQLQDYRDLLGALLGQKTYTLAEARALVHGFLKGKVN